MPQAPLLLPGQLLAKARSLPPLPGLAQVQVPQLWAMEWMARVLLEGSLVEFFVILMVMFLLMQLQLLLAV